MSVILTARWINVGQREYAGWFGSMYLVRRWDRWHINGAGVPGFIPSEPDIKAHHSGIKRTRAPSSSAAIGGVIIGILPRILKSDGETLCPSSVAQDILRRFGDVSGLRINIKKSTAIRLAPRDIQEGEVHGFSLLAEQLHCRYLGIHVGSVSGHDRDWDLCLQDTVARIALAVAKPHTVAQRATIARAFIIPKLLYVARHAWPTRQMITRLHRMTKRFIWGTLNGHPRKAWLHQPLAEPPWSEGGMDIPQVYSALQTMAVTVVGEWAHEATGVALAVGDILQGGRGPIALEVGQAGAVPVYKDSLWAMGTAVVRLAHGWNLTGNLATAMTKASTWTHGAITRARRIAESLTVELTGHELTDSMEAAAVLKYERGPFNAEWVRLVDTCVKGALWRTGTDRVSLKDYTYCGTTTQLDHLVKWTWVRPGVLKFARVRRAYPLGNSHAEQLKRICAAILVTYPGLLR